MWEGRREGKGVGGEGRRRRKANKETMYEKSEGKEVTKEGREGEGGKKVRRERGSQLI